MVSTVNTQTHRMTVTQNGKVLRTLKVSTGRPGNKTETRSGIKVILSRESEHIMDSTTVGIPKGQPGYYRLKTEWAMRLTWSGEFLHSAPWSVGSQGSANVSHGCTNLSPSDAKWLFDRSKMGDVVKFVGSTRGLEEYNGYTMWNQTARAVGREVRSGQLTRPTERYDGNDFYCDSRCRQRDVVYYRLADCAADPLGRSAASGSRRQSARSGSL